MTEKTKAAEKETASVQRKEDAPAPQEAAPIQVMTDLPRRSIAFIGSECHPFVKTGGLGDVMYALPRELVRLNCDVRVILPRYACIPQKYQDKMVYRGEFYMDLGKTGRNYYVGIMEYICDGVVYDFIDNQEFFTTGNPYVNLVLAGMQAGVAAVIFDVVASLARDIFKTGDWLYILLMVLAFAASFYINVVYIILIAAAVGIAQGLILGKKEGKL